MGLDKGHYNRILTDISSERQCTKRPGICGKVTCPLCICLSTVTAAAVKNGLEVQDSKKRKSMSWNWTKEAGKRGSGRRETEGVTGTAEGDSGLYHTEKDHLGHTVPAMLSAEQTKPKTASCPWNEEKAVVKKGLMWPVTACCKGLSLQGWGVWPQNL